jgi:uncharacterized membrane protein
LFLTILNKGFAVGRIIKLLGVIFLVTGCNSYVEKQRGNPILPPSNFKISELNFSSVYSQVFRPNCISCHGSSGGVNLESYDAVKSQISKIYQSTVVQRRMPKAPAPALTQEQLGLLNAWIEAGAPQDSGAEGGTPVPAPLEPNFESIKSHILEVKCLSCHSPGKPVARIPLVTRDDLLNSPLDIVVPGNADESGIILAVTNKNPGKRMPPESDEQGDATGFSPLSENEIQILKNWINNGAKD